MSQFDRYDDTTKDIDSCESVFINPDEPNVVNIKFGKRHNITIPNKYQWEDGQKLRFLDADAHHIVECDFAVNGLLEGIVREIGDDGTVSIPNALFVHHGSAVCYVKHVSSNDTTVIKTVSFLINQRIRPDNAFDPEDEQTFRQWVIEQIASGTIRDITEETSDEDGGINVITVTMRDGETHTFTVKNGSKGSKGDTGKGIAEGGSVGQMLTKNSSADYDTTWVDMPKTIEVVQTEGNSVESVMSQKAVTDMHIGISNTISRIDSSISSIIDDVSGIQNITIPNVQSAISALRDNKADTAYVNAELSKKANFTDVYTKGTIDTKVDEINSSIGLKSDKTYVDTELAKKATTDSVSAVDSKFNNYYDKSSIDTKVSALNTSISSKADESEVSALSTQIANKVDKSYVDNAVSGKADASTVDTLSDAVESISGDVSDISSELSTISPKVTELSTTVSSIDARVTSVEGGISNIGEHIGEIDSHLSTLDTSVSGKAEESDLNDLSDIVDNKADTSYVNEELGKKANSSELSELSSTVSSLSGNVSGLQGAVSGMGQALSNKANLLTAYTEGNIASISSNGAFSDSGKSFSDYYDKTTIDTSLNNKADKSEIPSADKLLPDVTATDNGKVLGVENGEWSVVQGGSGGGLPEVTTEDNGKTLKVVGGEWSVVQGSDGVNYFSGNGIPGSAIVAKEGDIYRDTSTNKTYICNGYIDPSKITDLGGIILKLKPTGTYPEDGIENFTYSNTYAYRCTDITTGATANWYLINLVINNNKITTNRWDYGTSNYTLIDGSGSSKTNLPIWNANGYYLKFNTGLNFPIKLVKWFIDNAEDIVGLGSTWVEIKDNRISAYNATYANNVTTIDSNGNVSYVTNTVGVPKPANNSSYNGKFLSVSYGSFVYSDPLPTINTTTDVGKILKASSSGKWISHDFITKNDADPTSQTVANVGDMYYGSVSDNVYICTNYADPNNITSLVGLTCTLKTPITSGSQSYSNNLSFTSNGESFTGFYCNFSTKQYIYYKSGTPFIAYDATSGWVNDAYATIHITGGSAATDYYLRQFMRGNSTIEGVGSTWRPLGRVNERDISYSNIPMYCGKWVDGKDIYRRVYVVTSDIAKGNVIKVADKPSNMNLLVRGWGISEGDSSVKHSMTNSDITVYVSDDGVYAINNFTGYCERLYVIIEYTVV